MERKASEELYHVKQTMIDYHHDPSGASQNTTIYGTFTDLSSAKDAARNALFSKGYKEEWFATMTVNNGQEDWPHPGGVMVQATASDGQVFIIAIETTANGMRLQGDHLGKVNQDLYYVLQTTIYYEKDRSGGIRETELQGVFVSYQDAKNAALICLLDEDITKESFVQYDEFDGQTDWTYGEDVLVHAVAEGGENFLVEILYEK
jgi:hypothetical protein